jgi:transcriptional regulator with XRE-family HTH domain
MASRPRSIDAAAERGRTLTATVLRELRAGRIDRNISGALVAEAMGCSTARYSRFERGQTGGVRIDEACVALAAVGLELSVRVYPGGSPLRDSAHSGVITRFCAICHRSIKVLSEVPMPDTSDLRAWDLVLLGRDWRHAYEVETRPRDLQALERRIALKSRDSGFDAVSLVLLDSRHNREFVRLQEESVRRRFPVPASVALAALRAGSDPGRGSVILI